MPELAVLALAVFIATVFGVVTRKLRQPLVVSYILAGVVISLFNLVQPGQLLFLKSIPELSLAFLLFLVGIELDINELRSLGKTVIVACGIQVLISSVLLHLLLSHYLPTSTSFLTAIALSFSSTILIVKLLLERKDLVSLHGKLAIGVSLIEDLTAIIILVLLGVGLSSNVSIGNILLALFKGAFLIWLALYTGRKILPRILPVAAENAELLFLSGITWCLLFVALSIWFNFSTSIGAFLAGVSLAQSTYRIQISGKVKPLRDFFIMLFFINLGAQVSIPTAMAHLDVPILLVLYMAVVKPAIIFGVLTLLRFRVRTGFQTAILLSSVSEFSLIILFAAASHGLFPAEFVSAMVLGVVLSFIVSSFLISHSRTIYKVISPYLKMAERPRTFNLDYFPEGKGVFTEHAVLVGCHRSGQIILRALRRLFGDNLMVVDFNPEVIEKLKKEAVPCLYGDIDDPEIEDRLNLKEAKLVISTVRDLSDNLSLLDMMEKIQSKALVIVTAADNKEAVTLYERGAHHVSLPLNLEGANISHMVADHFHNLRVLAGERERKLGELKRMTN